MITNSQNNFYKMENTFNVPQIKEEFLDKITLGYDEYVYKLTVSVNEYKPTNSKNKRYTNKRKIVEHIFDGKRYNPPIRYSVFIKDIAQSYSKKFIDLFTSTDKELNMFYSDDVEMSNPKYKNKTKKGNFELKFLLTLNNNIVIEYDTDFSEHIKGDVIYNELATQSFDLYTLVTECIEDIKTDILDKDKRFLWDNNYLIKHFGYNVYDLKKLSDEERSQKIEEAYSLEQKLNG